MSKNVDPKLDQSTVMLILAALIVLLGRWARGQKFDWKVGPAIVVVILFISILETASAELAKGLATLAFVAALLTYAPDLLSNFPPKGGSAPPLNGPSGGSGFGPGSAGAGGGAGGGGGGSW